MRGLGEEEVSQWSVSAMCVMAPCSSVSRTMPIGLLKVYVTGVINLCCLCKVAINLYLLQLFRAKRVLYQIFSAWSLYTKMEKVPISHTISTEKVPILCAVLIEKVPIACANKLKYLLLRFIVDKQQVWYGSINMIGYHATDDNALRFCDTEIANNLMEMLWG